MKKHRISLIILVSVLCVLAAHAKAAEPKTVVYDLVGDDAKGAEKLLHKANQDLASGREVIIKIDNIASPIRSNVTSTSNGSDFPLQEELEDAMRNGAKVIICPLWMREETLAETNLIAGIIINESDVLGDSVKFLACTP